MWYVFNCFVEQTVRTHFCLFEEQEVSLTGKMPCNFKATACV